MLTTLYIQNYALIDKLSIDFHKGLNSITGETGAGKSILLGALGLVLGNRADSSVLYNRDKKCVVEAEFEITNQETKDLLIENDIDFDVHTIIRREIAASGKSRAFINDTPVNLSLLSKTVLNLIDIHSQHQSFQINKQSFWLSVIDKIAGNSTILNKYKLAFQTYREALKLYADKKQQIGELDKEKEFVEHQLNELIAADLGKDTLDELEEELSKHEHAEEIASQLTLSIAYLNNEQSGDIYQLNQVKTNLEKIRTVFPLAAELAERIESIYIELKDINAELENAAESIEFTPERLAYLQERTSLYFSLFQKHRVDTQQELIQLRDNLQSTLNTIVDGDVDIEQLKKRVEDTKQAASKLAADVTKQRLAVLDKISMYIVGVLMELGMADSSMNIQHQKEDLSESGQDNFRFLFSANKNIPLNEISKIASGGELSRLMLAVKSLMSNTTGLPTIIFDEIDTGVSGEVAHKMGNIIRDMANSMQVINITHLPQVASKGDAHFLVHKNNTGKVTTTQVKKLDNEERLMEIAKMLSGEQVSEASLENARILLKS